MASCGLSPSLCMLLWICPVQPSGTLTLASPNILQKYHLTALMLISSSVGTESLQPVLQGNHSPNSWSFMECDQFKVPSAAMSTGKIYSTWCLHGLRPLWGLLVLLWNWDLSGLQKWLILHPKCFLQITTKVFKLGWALIKHSIIIINKSQFYLLFWKED